MGSFWLSNSDRYHEKTCSDLETVASSLGLILRQNQDKSSLQKDESFIRLKEFVNSLDFSSIITEGEGIQEALNDHPRAPCRLGMLSTPVPDVSDTNTTSGISNPALVKTPSSSGVKGVFVKSSPNLKDISESIDLDTPEKSLMFEKRAKTVISDINELCSKHRESL